MLRSDIIVEVRDVNLNRIGVVSPVQASFVVNHLAVGKWSLTVLGNDPLAAVLSQPGAGIVVSAPWGTLLSGSRTGFQLQTTLTDPIGTLTVSGEDDKTILWGHAIFPDPAHDANAQTAAYYTGTVAAETLIHNLVNLNTGPGAIAARKSAQELAVILGTDGGHGASYTANYRFDNLGDTIAAIAKANSLGFSLRQVSVGGVAKLQFDTYQVVDRSPFVRLTTAGGTLQSLSYTEQGPSLTSDFVAGQGDGVTRNIRIVRDTTAQTAWGRVWEGFRDRRDTNDNTVLDQQGSQDLVNAQGRTTPKFLPTDGDSMRYGADWREGDLIAVGPSETVEPVTAAVITLDQKSARIAAQIGYN